MGSIETILEGEFDVSIPNFGNWQFEHKEPKNGKQPRRVWFALSVDFYSDPKVMQLAMSERSWWLHLLAMYARSPSYLQRTTCELLAKSVGSRGQGPSKSLLKLAKLQLIDLQKSALQTDKQDNTDRQTGEKNHAEHLEVHSAPEVSAVEVTEYVIPELADIDDELFSAMTPAAQKSWVREFGVEFLRTHVPTFHSNWKMEQPLDSSGRVRPLQLIVKNYLTSEKRFRARQGPDDPPVLMQQPVSSVDATQDYLKRQDEFKPAKAIPAEARKFLGTIKGAG